VFAFQFCFGHLYKLFDLRFPESFEIISGLRFRFAYEYPLDEHDSFYNVQTAVYFECAVAVLKLCDCVNGVNLEVITVRKSLALIKDVSDKLSRTYVIIGVCFNNACLLWTHWFWIFDVVSVLHYKCLRLYWPVCDVIWN